MYILHVFPRCMQNWFHLILHRELVEIVTNTNSIDTLSLISGEDIMNIMSICILLYIIIRYYVSSAPCAPQNVTVALQCLNNTAFVSWNGSPGAVGYNVTALGHDGDFKYSIVNGTSCQLPNMHCSQIYDIVITPFSKTCSGFPSATYTFSAGRY